MVAEQLREAAALTLVHYFTIAGVDFRGDMTTDVRTIVDNIVEAAKEELREELREEILDQLRLARDEVAAAAAGVPSSVINAGRAGVEESRGTSKPAGGG